MNFESGEIATAIIHSPCDIFGCSRQREEISHSFTVRSSPPEASVRPSGETSMEKTSHTWPLSLRGCPRPERSHKVMLLSVPADSIVRPSGVNPTAFTIPIEPRGWASLRGENAFGSLAKSQAIISPPVLAETSRFVFGENAMAHTQPV